MTVRKLVEKWIVLRYRSLRQDFKGQSLVGELIQAEEDLMNAVSGHREIRRAAQALGYPITPRDAEMIKREDRDKKPKRKEIL